MKPDLSIFKSGVAGGMTAHALVERGQAYGIYIHHGKPGYLHNSDSRDHLTRYLLIRKRQVSFLVYLPGFTTLNG